MNAVDSAKSNSEEAVSPGMVIGEINASEIHIKGKTLKVPSAEIEGRTVITTGSFFKIASVREEELVEGDTVSDPISFIQKLKASSLRADIFTFSQRIPNAEPKYSYPMEWESLAALRIGSFDEWWKDTEHSVRKAVNRAKKLGTTVKVVPFDEDLLAAISKIYNETSVRQGKTFWHYGKDLDTVRHALATYLDRSVFIGAYFKDELIGFMKITWVGPTAPLMQILSMQKHFDKRPNNLMIAKAIELCAAEGKSHLIYDKFVYYDPNSSLTEFKRRIGFEPVPLPRYYIPLTLKGRLALLFRLHRGIAGNLPRPMMHGFLKARKFLLETKLKKSEKNEAKAGVAQR